MIAWYGTGTGVAEHGGGDGCGRGGAAILEPGREPGVPGVEKRELERANLEIGSRRSAGTVSAAAEMMERYKSGRRAMGRGDDLGYASTMTTARDACRSRKVICKTRSCCPTVDVGAVMAVGWDGYED